MLLQQCFQRSLQLLVTLVLYIQRGRDGDGGGFGNTSQLLHSLAVLPGACRKEARGAVRDKDSDLHGQLAFYA
jgi:hypothetical protein